MSEWTGEKEKDIDIKQCLFYIWDHIVVVLIVAILMAGALSVLEYTKESKEIQTANSPKTIISAVTDMNHDAWYPKDNNKYYYSDENPIAGSYIIKSQLYIDFNFDNIENNEQLEYSSIINRMQDDAMETLLSANSLYYVVSQVNTNSYGDIPELTTDDLKLMIHIDTYGSNVVTYAVTDASEQRALDVANLLNALFCENSQNIANIDKVTIIEEPSLYYHSEIKTNSVSTKNLIKYALIGGVVGVILMCGIYLLLFILKDTVRIKDDLDYLGIKNYGSVGAKGNKDSSYRRIAYNISCLEEKNSILIAPVGSKTEISDMVDAVSKELKSINSDIKIKSVDDVVSSPDIILEAKKSDGVILVAKYGTTLIKDMNYAMSEVEKTNKELIGAIIVDVKHV